MASVDLQQAATLCKHFEGFRSKPYKCPAGVPTIGYGSTYYANGTKVTMADPSISQAAAEQLLMRELHHSYLPGVLRLCPGLYPHAILNNDPGIINAITDFTYNLGVGRLQTSTLRRKLNAQDWEAAKVELKKWRRGGGRILPGLVRRRAAECGLF